MDKIKDGGPAFPHPGGASDSTVQESHLGLSLRDYFATSAMNAFYSSFDCRNADMHPLSVAEDAKVFFMIADAMLKARGGKS